MSAVWVDARYEWIETPSVGRESGIFLFYESVPHSVPLFIYIIYITKVIYYINCPTWCPVWGIAFDSGGDRCTGGSREGRRGFGLISLVFLSCAVRWSWID